MTSRGGLDKLKATLCAREDLQETGGLQIYSPTASIRLLKMFIALGVEMKRKVKQLDFVSAFIQGKVRSRICVHIEDEMAIVCPEFKMYIGRPLQLERAICGLATTEIYWYEDLDEYLQNLSFRISTVEPCLYARTTCLGTVRLINYVDDTLYFANTDEAEEEFTKQLKARFNFHLLGTAH